MSEIPERIEREMYEIRNRMSPDVRDLKKHTEPKVIGKQVGDTVKAKAKAALSRFGKSLSDSAKRQLNLAREAGRSRNPTPFTDAVKSDPRPMVVLAVVLTFTLLALRKLSG
ncbi:Protein of unknown function (DUF3618) [Rubrobacter radiotolerans]|uniref:DUF3618 domain-containing protein n=1 Tax=Rubrobacter radiotolerans TaxID=42256 RepID=A0A023X7G4_RUBRA|nr:DUF3618 domain-containing protein [Rubrobacter radiotolerans]AHY47999.1 Protein of unknown function (DUF3618) [Rubrobacter radiotolerans]MDX5892638.1 DUF3618 domain-containing protein [Rubrobacter radiotolerans]SMC07984.1 Protein of unknown function [Rubrobacter radiotolerans DSM 5868]